MKAMRRELWLWNLATYQEFRQKSNRKSPWDYNKQLYKQRNQVERLFRRIKRFRRIFTRYDKLDSVFLAFICFAFIVDALM